MNDSKAIWAACMLLAVALVAGVQKCAAAEPKWYFEVGVGKNANLTGCSDCWEDGGSPGAYFALRREQHMAGNTYWFFQYVHLSNWLAGPPFNDKPETSVDHIGAGFRWELDW